MPKVIIFSDLDGTLLDHENYSYAAATPALETLKALDIPLILASSKTAAEISALRTDMGFDSCYAIVENGCGILPPGNFETDQIDQSEYNKIISYLDQAPSELRTLYKGFNDWGVPEIVRITGLSEQAAVKSAKRQFSEPGLWSGNDRQKEDFLAYLKDKGIHARQGGRFMTLSFGATKGQRIKEIVEKYTSATSTPISLSLGDAPNDIEMLENTNFGVIIANDHGTPMPKLDQEDTGRIARTIKPGPEGWNEAVLQFISNYYPNNSPE